MKIMFTNSPLHFSHGHTFTQPDWQTLILPYLAGIVKGSYEINLVDNMNHSFWKADNIEEEVRRFKPDLLGISIIASRDIFNTIDRIEKVRQANPELKMIAGGQAGTYYDRWLLEAGVDFVVRGEGEKTLNELVEAIDGGETDFKGISGISFSDNRAIYRTKDRPRMKSLDESPMPRWDLMPKIRSKWFPGRYTGSIEMSRGCPFSCNFCAITAFWEKSFRQKSNDRIIEELKNLQGQGRTHVYLADDSFGMNSRKHTELFRRMVDEGLDIKFFAQIRTDTIADNPEMIEWAARAGMYGALIGFDTYDADTFNEVTKRGSIELNLEAARVLRKNKIAVFGCHIYGFANQKNPLDFWDTFRMGRENSDLFRMPHFMPLPGTKGYEDYVKVNPKDLSLEEARGHLDDFRPRVGDKKHQRKMARGYDIYNIAHNLSPSEVFGALFHRDPVIRRFKQRGYIGVTRHYLYRTLRKFRITGI